MTTFSKNIIHIKRISESHLNPPVQRRWHLLCSYTFVASRYITNVDFSVGMKFSIKFLFATYFLSVSPSKKLLCRWLLKATTSHLYTSICHPKINLDLYKNGIGTIRKCVYIASWNFQISHNNKISVFRYTSEYSFNNRLCNIFQTNFVLWSCSSFSLS